MTYQAWIQAAYRARALGVAARFEIVRDVMGAIGLTDLQRVTVARICTQNDYV